jgi:transposase InsO family protein
MAPGTGTSPGGWTPFGKAEAEALSRTVPPSANRVYGARRVCEELELARSTFYACQARRKASERVLLKRGQKTNPSFVRSPEGNSCAERFIKTLKEQLLWVRTFETIEEFRLALHEWLTIYNEQWLVERHGYRTPYQVRRELVAKRPAA